MQSANTEMDPVVGFGELLRNPMVFRVPLRLTPSSAWREHLPFAMYLISQLRPQLVVELGTHRGDSYCAMCQAVGELKIRTRCYAVDTWTGDEHAGLYGEQVFEDLKKHHDPLYSGFSTLLRMTFDGARERFADGSIDLLHVDGLHTYGAVKHDFMTWLPKMSQQSIMLFHDISVFDRDFGVHQLWAEIADKYPSFSFHHGHGLGVLCAGGEVPNSLIPFFEIAQRHPEEVRSLFSQVGALVSALVNDRNRAEAAERQLSCVHKSRTYKISRHLATIYTRLRRIA